jgi:glycosyltransferase involved in cell wall biosynthesis
MKDMVGVNLYNGAVYSESSRVILVIAGRPERGFNEYQEILFAFFNKLAIEWVYIGDCVRSFCSEDEGLFALYPDIYTMADFVLYPTGWEGFGNQLLEAFAAKLPVALFEYPVFKEDIAPKGVKIVSLGDYLSSSVDAKGLVEIPSDRLTQAAQQIKVILTSAEKYTSITGHNFLVGKQNFSFEILQTHLRKSLDWAGSYAF